MEQEIVLLKNILKGIQTLTFIGGTGIGISLVYLFAKNWGRDV